MMQYISDQRQNTVTYTRSNYLSGTLQGAGGIGGLFARSEIANLESPHAYYHADGNGNITALIDTNQVLVAQYHYDPYGDILGMAGPLAEANLYRFSNKEIHPNSGLVYYLYRYYDRSFQRWINRDPIDEAGGLNLYAFLPALGGDGLDPFGLCAPGDKQNIKVEIALVPDGLDPNRVEAIPVLADLAKDVKAFGIILAAAETGGASALGASETAATGLKGAMQVGAHPSGLSDALKKVAAKVLKQQAAGGVVPHIRITYQECEPRSGLFGGLASLFGAGNKWVDKTYPEDWVPYKGPSDLPGGYFFDPKEALRRALEQGRRMLREFEKQGKKTEEGDGIDL